MSKSNSRINAAEVGRYFSALADYLARTEVTSASGEPLDLAEAVNQVIDWARKTHAAGNKLIFLGNGGSAAIASHMAADFSKNGNVRSLALNDSSMLTCISNDLGYHRVFAEQIGLYAARGDLILAISSSGGSANILHAVDAARKRQCAVVTLSGFAADNPLRGRGDLNFYIASDRYGFVEIGHLTICHAILDFLCGLRVSKKNFKGVTDHGGRPRGRAKIPSVNAPPLAGSPCASQGFAIDSAESAKR
jgi:D-sedoheptulose 7-phosphate isomerase